VTEVITDGARNVIPSSVVIRGDTRSFSTKVSDEIEQAMRRLAVGTCSACGVDCEVDYTHEFRPLVTTAPATAAALRAATQVFRQIEEDCRPEMPSEDFAHLLVACGDGSFGLIGTAPVDGEAGVNLHNPHYDFNDDALPLGIRYWTALAADRLGSEA
jgi:hippurate hydrolase